LLWQTRAAPREAGVADEVETALSYLRDVFLPVLPALYARWDRELGERAPSFLRAGSWIGGDRDGNPFVTADSMKLALARSAEAVLAYYIDAVHALGAELSISTEHASVSEAVLKLAEASGDTGRAARRALSPRAHRHLCAALARLTRSSPASAPPPPPLG
jgi:phosphoenolpyruvate carboxylase